MNLIGIFGCIAMLIMGEKPKRFGTCVYFTHGRRWGGVCLGGFFFVSEDSNTLYTKAHESGHAIQNMILGPLFPFVVGIPSMIRYHLFGKQNNKQKQKLAIMLCSGCGIQSVANSYYRGSMRGLCYCNHYMALLF